MSTPQEKTKKKQPIFLAFLELQQHGQKRYLRKLGERQRRRRVRLQENQSTYIKRY